MNFPKSAAAGLDSPRRSKRAGVVASVLVAFGLFGVAVGLSAAPVSPSSAAASALPSISSSCQNGLLCLIPQAVRWQ